MKISLVGAPYSGKSVIASGQECVNLYAEINAGDPQAPTQVTYYPTPGTVLFADPHFIKSARGAYRTSIGTAYYVVGQNVYFLTSANILTLVGLIADRTSQVKFSDNGLVCVIVDGVNGYVIDLVTNSFGIILDPNFYGADYIALLDTFFIFNRPKTNQFYISASNASYGMLTNSAIATGNITNSGAGGGINGVYQNVPLTGGSGSGAIASSITVTGGFVTGVNIGNGGVNYLTGDVLSAAPANIGGVTLFAYTVATLASAFDPLDIAAKSGFNDPIVGIVSVHRELWLIGALTTEIWIGTGAADFYFQEVQGSFINHGSTAQYSIATQDVLVFFLMQNQQGKNIVVQGMGYDVHEISNPRVVSEFNKYATTSDAIGFCFQIEDHSYYALIFPTANKGWLYDLTTKWWYEWNYTDADGNLNRPRANCFMFANNTTLVGDWQNGVLLKLDINTFTDYTPAMPTGPINRIRTFPHSIDGEGYHKVSYRSFTADIEVGTAQEGDDPQISLSWSDNKGQSYGNPVMQSMGKIGEFLASPKWNNLGEARDRVFKLSWSTVVRTALNAGYIEVRKSRN